jgi:CHAD domain-containing protein
LALDSKFVRNSLPSNFANTISDDFFEDGSFAETYAKLRKSLSKKLDLFSEDPNERNTHDVRTAIRRMNASLELFPKKTRQSKKFRRTAKKLRKVMKESAAVRDLDVISGRLSRHPQNAPRKKLLAKIAKSRKKRAEEVERAAKAKLSLPKPREMSPAKLRKRLVSELKFLSKRISVTIPMVLDDPGNIEDVHSLRKYCKKTRYLLELAPTGSEMAGAMKSWQDVLGSIHDGDITIAYLTGIKRSSIEIKEMIAAELRDRDHDYEKFIQTCIRR